LHLNSITNEQQGSVHDCSARQHGGHQNVVTGAIHEGDVSQQLIVAGAVRPLARKRVLFGRTPGDVAHGAWAFFIVAFEDLCVGIAYEKNTFNNQPSSANQRPDVGRQVQGLNIGVVSIKNNQSRFQILLEYSSKLDTEI